MDRRLTDDIVEQFGGWRKGKSRYLFRRRIEAILPHLPRQGRALDAGCGDLETRERIAEARPDLEVFCCDLGRLSGPRAVRADVQALPFAERSFDAVLLLAVIEHVPSHQAALSDARRVLRPGGVLLVTTPNPVYGLPMALAGRIGLKYREGYDHGASLGRLARMARAAGLIVEREAGFLLAPFATAFDGAERFLGRHRISRWLLLNQLLVARRVH
jgi:SAM-dependent methyltransferase